jgi:DNA-binding YbaB/EbfC family protein
MNIQKMMQQAQQMQERLQKQMTEMRLDATAGGGMVTVTVNGNKQLLKLVLDPEVVSKDDVEMLQDLIVAAVADAHRKVDEALASPAWIRSPSWRRRSSGCLASARVARSACRSTCSRLRARKSTGCAQRCKR